MIFWIAAVTSVYQTGITGATSTPNSPNFDWSLEHARLKQGANMEHVWIDAEQLPSSSSDSSPPHLDLSYPDSLTMAEPAASSSSTHHDRFLWESYDKEESKSNLCKTKCIDQDKVYCGNWDYSGGKCYDQSETPEKEGGYCSNNSPNAP